MVCGCGLRAARAKRGRRHEPPISRACRDLFQGVQEAPPRDSAEGLLAAALPAAARLALPGMRLHLQAGAGEAAAAR